MSDHQDNRPLHPDQLTWAALLSRWVSFARGAVALPDDPQSRKLRDSISDVIMLQAVWFALHHLDELEANERPLGIDRASVLIDKHTRALKDRWAEDEMPDTMRELIDDAREKLYAIGSSSSDDDSAAPPSTTV